MRILFVEGLADFRLLGRFARRAGFAELAGGLEFTPAESEGFGNWKRVQSVAWGMKRTLGKALRLGAVFDRDYRPDEETDEILAALRNELDFAVIHDRKEMENYLLVPTGATTGT